MCLLQLIIDGVSLLTGTHLWRSKYGSFMRHAQVEFCHRLIVMPLTAFHRLAEEIGDPQAKIIFGFTTARCGSTLLAQVNHCRSDNIMYSL